MVGSRINFVVLLIVAVLPIAGQDKSVNLPDGKGRDAVKRICTSCHEIGMVVASRRTIIGWQQNVEDMISRGAEGSDDDFEAVVDYLTKFFGKINVNTASRNDLESALGLSAPEAQAIVAYKEHNGSFKNFEQLTKVPGINLEKLQAKRSQIAFSL